jgi:predicted methyltransferase
MRLTRKVHQILEDCLRNGDLAIDATAGNGYDTLKMAALVGTAGEVMAIDIQEAAIASTRSRVEAEGLADRVRLVHADHASFLGNSGFPPHRRAGAIVFNLGYLPGSDKAITTHPDTTIEALTAGLRLLRPGGVLLVTAYRGHPGGLAEAQAVESWIRSLDPAAWTVHCDEPSSRAGASLPPVLWAIRRIRD